MNISRWMSVMVVVLFIAVVVLTPMWRGRMGLDPASQSTDGRYAAFVILCMGLVCTWWPGTASAGQGRPTPVQGTRDDESDAAPETTGDGRRSMRKTGWLLLILSIVVVAADLIR